MKNKFTITISDVYGSRSFNLSQIIKKYLIYFTSFVFLVILASVSTAWYLKIELDKIETKKSELTKHNDELKNENSKLIDNIQSKNNELLSLNDKIGGIEELLGLKSADSTSTEERIDVATLSSVKKVYALQIIPNGLPLLENDGVTSKYGYRIHPISGTKEFHRGLDFRAKTGEDVLTTADGIVEYAGFHKESGYGNVVIIDHGLGFKTIYGHLNKTLVKAGTSVKKGEIIALSGNSGKSSGPHLHYEIKFVNRNLDPQNFVDWNLASFNDIFEKEKKVKWASLIDLIDRQISVLEKQLLQPGLPFAAL
ncbi:MAG: peptidoglycan DD-metalloendopeptidase family protein [Candidatus Delongbacteria bacterium]|nr:peptidoglycan DD-metalloendopeptidase family protein [Candidatus Delongbacteria bacterium]MBN2835816.1 peptidoglycan DD-metalloendopeptidase family protein [Candidatus Delongbacteria bacterium]